jgi:hypothetical protein
MGQIGVLGQDGAVRQAVAPRLAPPGTKEIPFDQVATFQLKGERGNRVQDVVNISIEGAFVAVSIGYSFVPARLADSDVDLARLGRALPVPTHPMFQDLRALVQLLGKEPLGAAVARCLLLRLCGVEFKYSIVDSASGRELQNKAIHSVAGLGEPNGHRPFRPLAKPMLFMPRSTIRIEIEEQSELPLYKNGELFIVLHGYKILAWSPSA